MNQHADAADMPLPTPELLMEGADANHLLLKDRQKRKVAPQINVLAPLLNQSWICHSMFNEHPFRFWHGQKELMKRLLVGRFERPLSASDTTFEVDFARELIQDSVKGHRRSIPTA